MNKDQLTKELIESKVNTLEYNVLDPNELLVIIASNQNAYSFLII